PPALPPWGVPSSSEPPAPPSSGSSVSAPAVPPVSSPPLEPGLSPPSPPVDPPCQRFSSASSPHPSVSPRLVAITQKQNRTRAIARVSVGACTGAQVSFRRPNTEGSFAEVSPAAQERALGRPRTRALPRNRPK